MATESAHRRPGQAPSTARWIMVAVCGAIIGCFLMQALDFPRAAADVRTQYGNEDVFAVAGQISSDTYGLYLIDWRKTTVAVYQYIPNTKKLRLAAVRNFGFDTSLDEYNTEPLPRKIKELVDQQRRLGSQSETQPQSLPASQE